MRWLARRLGIRPISPAEFPAALAPICEACGIAIRDDGAAGIFLLKVKLAGPSRKPRVEGESGLTSKALAALLDDMRAAYEKRRGSGSERSAS